MPVPCTICLYRQTFEDAALYPVHMATHRGLSMVMQGEADVCQEHIAWVTDEMPETLQPLEDGHESR